MSAEETVTASTATPPESAATTHPVKQRAYPAPASIPTQMGSHGIRFDFNDGCRVVLPEGKWHVRLRDLDTGNILYETDIAAGHINTSKRYYLRCRIEVWTAGMTGEPGFHHDYNSKGQDVLVQFPVGTIGDTVGWFPYAVKFQEQHDCRLTCAMADKLIPLFQGAYPQIRFVTHEQVIADQFYATYSLGLFFDDEDRIHQPCDFRLVGLHRTAGYILGVDPTEIPPKIALDDDRRPIQEPYVCIAVQSSTNSKNWTNPNGWHEVVRFLKEAGYRVICIDQKHFHGTGLVWNHIPHGVEDQTGDRPLPERACWIKHADFFIGLSSGLSWLAWSVGTPVVMISGFTHPTNEFQTPYRIINYHTCNSCWNDVRVRFDHKDFLWCPRHAGTARQFECTRLITADAVNNTIRQIPAFKQRHSSVTVLPHPRIVRAIEGERSGAA